MRVLNSEQILSHGNINGRKDIMEILEAGLRATDPYNNTMSLFERDGNILKVGNPRFEADGDPNSGIDTLDLNDYNRVFVVGAGKGVQRIAKAIEDVLGDWLTCGEVISKHGDESILKRIGNTYGAHPTPDEGCVAGSKKIFELSKDITERDLVFTIITNGGSSLLTLPCDGISLKDVEDITYLVQIVKGIPTSDLNNIRNNIDRLKAGRITRAFHPAKMYHLFGADANCANGKKWSCKYEGMTNYERTLRSNRWLHNLPDASTFEDAKRIIEMYDLKSECPKSILDAIYEADPANEVLKYEEYIMTNSRFFGIMPDDEGVKASRDKAVELGYDTYVLTRMLCTEAKAAAQMTTAIALNIDLSKEPFVPPVALITAGELLVTVGKSTGIGGRNQEFCLSAAMSIKDRRKIIIGSVDSDGTDGPGGLNLDGAPDCLGGAIVDGHTAIEAEEMGLCLFDYLKEHASSEPLWKLGSGLNIEHGISTNDITVTLIQK